MFTHGLDQSAINWVTKGSDAGTEAGSPAADSIQMSRSPLACTNGIYMPPHTILPPLKFHSGLIAAHRVSSSIEYSCAYGDYDDESVGSVPADSDGKYQEDVESSDTGVSATSVAGGHKSLINRESSMVNLKIQVPESVRRFSDADIRDSDNAWGHGEVHPHSAQGVPFHYSRLYDLGTPSAPPMNNIEIEGDGQEGESRKEPHSGTYEPASDERVVYMSREAEYFEETKRVSTESAVNYEDNQIVLNKYSATCSHGCSSTLLTGEQIGASSLEIKMQNLGRPANSMDFSPCYKTTGQNASFIAYDACIQICLHERAKGCRYAPEFLRDECLKLRSAFGLHEFCLHSRHNKPIDAGATGARQSCPPKMEKVVGKIRVEVKKLRIIPRRKLKSIASQRGAFYMQAGAEYVKQVSSVMRNGISSVMNSSLSVTSEEKLSCFFLLKSSANDGGIDSGSAICLHPGTGEHHEFFPESPGDALLVEVKDRKQIIQGQAVIPVSAFADNPSSKIHWWPIYQDGNECVGKIQLSITSTIRSSRDNHIQTGPVVETLAYDLLLEAAMRAEHFHSHNLRLQAPWNWLLTQFADHYGVSDSYTQLRYLSFVMNVATPTKDCLGLVGDLLLPVIKARSERRLNRQEKSILLDCESQVESLLANVFENYKSLDEYSPSGLSNALAPTPESAPPALAPAVQLYTLLHDILSQDAQTHLQNYLQIAVKKRCRKLMVDTEELLSANLEDLLDPISISTAYSKMKNLCTSISTEIHGDIKIHNYHILPSAIDLPNIAAGVYSTELCKKFKGFLAACPPSSPLPHVNELLIATADFERNLESWNISPIEGGVDSKNLFSYYIMTWVQDMELRMLDICKGEKIPWSGINSNHSTSLFVENMYTHIRDELIQYEVVMSRWPEYSLVLENAIANVERAILKTLEKQYSDILTPLKDSIPKNLRIQVQKLARRQSIAMYSVPHELGTFLNTVKRILDVLHIRVEDILKSWASYLPSDGDRKSYFGEQMSGVAVVLRAKYKNYIQAIVTKLYSNLRASRCTQMKRILDETEDSDGEAEIRERMQMLSSQLIDSISNLHQVFTTHIFIAVCRGFWDRMGQSVLKFLEGRKENRIWYKGSYYALGILDDIFASQMQRLQGNALQEKDLEPPRSVAEVRSILCRDATNGTDRSTYFYF
ncbi:hypothetical protein Dimus_019614 [Dionaea muscipula]